MSSKGGMLLSFFYYMLLYLLLGLIAVGLLLLSAPGKNILGVILIIAGVLIVVGIIVIFLVLLKTSDVFAAIVSSLVCLIVVGLVISNLYKSYKKGIFTVKNLKGFLKKNKLTFTLSAIFFSSPIIILLLFLIAHALHVILFGI